MRVGAGWCPVSARVIALPGRSLHETVLRAAGGRCECTGRCGSDHRSGGGRCLAEPQPRRPLHAVPRDLAVSAAEAARLPASDLMALCGHCYDGAARRAVRRPHSAPQGVLFGDAP